MFAQVLARFHARYPGTTTMNAADQLAAAERIRRHDAAMLTPRGAEIHEYTNGSFSWVGDMADLARAWLTEHDPTPLDEAWLRSVGWKYWPKTDDEEPEYELYVPMADELGWKCRLAYQSNGIYAVRMADPDVFDGIAESVELWGTRNTTNPISRGELRRLCSALSIPLTA